MPTCSLDMERGKYLHLVLAEMDFPEFESYLAEVEEAARFCSGSYSISLSKLSACDQVSGQRNTHMILIAHTVGAGVFLQQNL